MTDSGAGTRRFEIAMDRSRAPRAFRDKNNLWHDDLRRIYRLIDRQVEALRHHRRQQSPRHSSPRAENRYHEERPHLSIAIFGPSGSGKSSLIRTLADDIRRSHSPVMPKEMEKRVVTLPVMNPTTWAPTDQFLYAFLAAALEEERIEQESQEHGYPQGLSPVQLAFQDVNEYLRVVDEPERSEEHDPLGLSLQKLERHTSGLRLRTALSQLIERLAETLRAELVLLPVDDLDMAPDHLVDSLQSYQSFLNHPRLVPVFTFTDRMPEELIEVHYKQQLGAAASHRRLESINRLSISEQMAVQFLARCFPVRNRIRLGPAPARVQRALYSPGPSAGSSKEEPEQAKILELLVQASFLLFGNPDAEDSHKVRAALRPSTLRRQLQVVDAMSDCRLWSMRTPQFGAMAGLEAEEIAKIETLRLQEDVLLPELCTDPERDEVEAWKLWKSDKDKRRRLGAVWGQPELQLLPHGSSYDTGYRQLARGMLGMQIGATWATIFSGAAWSLLNVHRDTLRELGLFLEDLYSWTPKELRSVVLENILAQDLVTRRTVVDRWFNRTDYRRSQVLSLLAANVFRPWMPGEEPFGDEETPIREQIELEQKLSSGSSPVQSIDQDPANGDVGRADPKYWIGQISQRLTIPGPKGLLWFLNVTLGFYLPQIMARNWDRAMSSEVPVKSRMSGNGWDMFHAATNAVRIADAKQEIFSFGMMFLHPDAYRKALEVAEKNPAGDDRAAVDPRWEFDGSEESSPDLLWRRHLLLRIWSSCGYSSGRYWSAFSLWRGLGFMGQILGLGLRHRGSLENLGDARRCQLQREISRLLRIHILSGYVPGSLLNKNSDDDRLLQAFPRWNPGEPVVGGAIRELSKELLAWLQASWLDPIYPLPAGDLWLGWKECFIRRIHGEYILGGLWPRINSAYLEKYDRNLQWVALARNRAHGERIDWKSQHDTSEGSEPNDEQLRWTATLAAGTWSDILFEYWKGCPPILMLLMTCPVLYKSHPRFGASIYPEGSSRSPKTTFEQCLSQLKERTATDNETRKDPRLAWLSNLGLPPQAWEMLATRIGDRPGLSPTKHLVSSELAIPRVETEDFTAPGRSHHSLYFEQNQIEVQRISTDPTNQKRKKEPAYSASLGLRAPSRAQEDE